MIAVADRAQAGPAHDAGAAAVVPTAPCFTARPQHGLVHTSGPAHWFGGQRLPAAAGADGDGLFASWDWDGRELVLHNDRYGIQPLFWTRLAGGGIAVSPSLVRLLAAGASSALDPAALAVFFRLGFFLGEDTPFAAIGAVPPAAEFRWRPGQLLCRGHRPAAAAITSLSRDAAINHYLGLFAEAMQRRADRRGTLAVPISGGRDSRHILLELHRLGIQPALCVSARDNPPDPNQDPIVARQLCAALGFPHVVIDQRLSLLSAQRRKNLATHFCASTHGWYLALADFLHARFDTVHDGLAGDVWSQSAFLDPTLAKAFASGCATRVADTLLSLHAPPRAALTRVLGKSLRAACSREVAIERLKLEIQTHWDAPNPIASFFFWNRTRRMTALAPCALLTGIDQVHTPFLDHALFDFMTTLPLGMLMDRRFHTDALARGYPAFAHIPYADHKHASPTDDTAVRRRLLTESLARYAWRKPCPLLNNISVRGRILAGWLSHGHLHPFISPLVSYLDQIDSIMSRPSTPTRHGTFSP